MFPRDPGVNPVERSVRLLERKRYESIISNSGVNCERERERTISRAHRELERVSPRYTLWRICGTRYRIPRIRSMPIGPNFLPPCFMISRWVR